MAALVAWAAILSMATGCRATQSLLGNRDAESRTTINWVQLPEMDPVNASQSKIYLRFKNMVGANEFDFIKGEIESAAVDLGYTVTNNPDEADFFYRIDLRAFNENPDADGGSSTLNALGAVAVGGATFATLDSAGANPVLGGAVAVGTGAVANEMFSNFTKVTEWNLVIDIAIGERIDGGVNTNENYDRDAASSVNTGAAISDQQGVGGRDQSVSGRRQDLNTVSDWYYRPARLLAVARQIRMTRDEAVAALRNDLSGSLPQLLP